MARVLHFPRESAFTQTQQLQRVSYVSTRRFQLIRGYARALSLIDQCKRRALGLPVNTSKQIGELHA